MKQGEGVATLNCGAKDIQCETMQCQYVTASSCKTNYIKLTH